MHKKSSPRNCPICNSASKDILSKIEFELFDGHPMNGGYNVVQCSDCGFVFADTGISQSDLDKYYTELSKYEDKISTGGGYSQNDKDRLAATAIFLSEHIGDKGARVLDLGCANGGLLKEFRSLGYNNIVGIDPSYACVEITKSVAECDCFQYSIFNIPESVGKFDVIILSHVLEHVLSVKETISILNNLLNEGGHVYLECPNASNYKKVIHAPLQEFNTEHINHFTETAFRNLMENNQYETIVTGNKIFKIASDQDYNAVYGFFKKNQGVTNKGKVKFDETIRADIEAYITASDRMFDEIKTVLLNLPSDMPIALIGIGQFAFKLLKTPVFQNATKLKLFDNSRANIGLKVGGMPILPGSEIVAEFEKEKFSIVISSMIHEAAIKKNLIELFHKSGIEFPVIAGFSHALGGGMV